MRYLDPKADLTFKKIFCKHKDLLISLLNAPFGAYHLRLLTHPHYNQICFIVGRYSIL